MDWILVGEIAFQVGAFLAASFVVYGAWLCIAAPAAKSSAPESQDEARREPGVPAGPVCLAIACILALPAFPGAARADDPFERGNKAYRESRYADALAHYQVAADGGNARAQEILGFMYMHGPSSYSAGVPRDREQAIYWFGRAAREGREVAQRMLCILSGRPGHAAADRVACASGTVATSTPRGS
jgi:TPR repeat protein